MRLCVAWCFIKFKWLYYAQMLTTAIKSYENQVHLNVELTKTAFIKLSVQRGNSCGIAPALSDQDPPFYALSWRFLQHRLWCNSLFQLVTRKNQQHYTHENLLSDYATRNPSTQSHSNPNTIPGSSFGTQNLRCPRLWSTGMSKRVPARPKNVQPLTTTSSTARPTNALELISIRPPRSI